MAEELYFEPRLKRSMSWPKAESDEESVGTFARLRSSSLSREEDFERFAKSIDRSLAVFSLGFCRKREGGGPFFVYMNWKTEEAPRSGGETYCYAQKHRFEEGIVFGKRS